MKSGNTASKRANRRSDMFTPKKVRKENRIRVSDISEDSLTETRAKRPRTQTKRKVTRRPRRSEFQQLKELCQTDSYAIGPEGSHVLAMIEDYCKRHFSSMEPWVLRELLRVAHKSLPKGAPKSKIRGILGYFTRSTSTKNWMKIAIVLRAVAAQEKVKTFVQPKEIPFDRVVDESEILSMSGNPRYMERIQVMDAKIERLKKTGSNSMLAAIAEGAAPSNTSPIARAPNGADMGQARLTKRPGTKKGRVKMLAKTAAMKKGFNTLPPSSESERSSPDTVAQNSSLNRYMSD